MGLDNRVYQFRRDKGFIALHVYDKIGVDFFKGFDDSLRARAAFFGSHNRGSFDFVGKLHNLDAVGEDYDFFREAAFQAAFVDALDNRLAAEQSQRLAGEAGRAHSGRDCNRRA